MAELNAAPHFLGVSHRRAGMTLPSLLCVILLLLQLCGQMQVTALLSGQSHVETSLWQHNKDKGLRVQSLRLHSWPYQ